MSIEIDLNKLNKEYLICIDSDGCVFDSMELKHKECFAPNVIRFFNLQGCSRYAREVWEYVNLYSTHRGCNRFIAVIELFELLNQREEARDAGFVMPDIAPLKSWVKAAPTLDNVALEKHIKTNPHPFLITTLNWSVAVNESVASIVGKGIPPFKHVINCLQKMNESASVICCSATPNEALHREWEEHGLSPHVSVIAGQEFGTKTHIIAGARVGKEGSRVLMIGDAPGDLKAAESNGVLFYPIIPSHEQESWRELYHEGLKRFIGGNYEEYGEKLKQRFLSSLLTKPNFKLTNNK